MFEELEKYCNKREDVKRLVSKTNNLASNIVICSYALSNKHILIYESNNQIEVENIDIEYNKDNFLRLALFEKDYDSSTINRIMQINKIMSQVDELKEYEANGICYQTISNSKNKIVFQRQLIKNKKA